MGTILNILLFLLILGILVFVHEFGHFITAKKNGVFIHEFSIGMGPAIKTWKGKDGIDYSLRALPIGGYVQMAGEIYEDDDTKTVPKDKFMCNKKWWQRLIILCAGVFNNFLLALILLFFIALIWGAPSLAPKIHDVIPNSSVAATQKIEIDEEGNKTVISGIQSGDIITKINGKKVKTWDKAQLLLLYKDKDGKYDITVKHTNGETESFQIERTEFEDSEGEKMEGFGFEMKSEINKGFKAALKYAFQKFAAISEQMWMTLGGLFSGKISLNSLSGPVGIYTVVGETRKTGIANVIFLTAYLSINLGIMNILPIPALDGGHVLFLLIEMITRKKVNKTIEAWATNIFFVLLILLMIYISIHDVFTFIIK